MTKKQKKKLYNIIISFMLILVLVILDEMNIIQFESNNKIDVYTQKDSNFLSGYVVTRVVDGDTIVVTKDGENIKVRLIGINTAESVHADETKNTEFGKIASNYTKEKLLNKQVELELDVQEKDQYGRTLAYVYLKGEMFNKTLLKDGMAQVATYPPNVKYVEEFVKIEKEARENNVGLWSYK